MPKTDSRYGQWLLATLGAIALMAGVTVWVNWRLDVLGLFGSDHVTRYSLDRYSTYAMSYRYIPEHFDGLLLGNSVTTNWDTSLISGYRVFNCSIRGANFSEEDLIAQNAMAHGHLKMMIILLQPTFTASHGRMTPYMTRNEYWSSLGSVQMFTIYAQMLAENIAGPDTRRWVFQHRAFAFGGERFRIWNVDGPADEPSSEFNIDSTARKEIVDLIATAHGRHIRLYFLIPPTYSGRWKASGRQIQNYYDTMLKLVPRGDCVIDLHDGSLADMTQKHSNFPDYAHLTLPAALQASQLLGQRVAASCGYLATSR